MQLKNHPYQSWLGADSAFNGLRFFCDTVASMRNDIAITSGSGWQGNLDTISTATSGSPLNFSYVQRLRKSLTIVLKLRMNCNKREKFIKVDWLGLDLTSDWTSVQKCPDREVISGIRIQISGDSGKWLNSLHVVFKSLYSYGVGESFNVSRWVIALL